MGLKSFVVFSFLMAAVFLSFASAQATSSCNPPAVPPDTTAFLGSIPPINSALNKCNVSLPSSVGSLLGNGNVLVNISLNDGSTKNFYVTINNKQITGVFLGTISSTSYKVFLSEATLDKILKSSDKANGALVAYNNKEIKVVASGFFNKLKFFFAKFFIPKTSTSTSTSTGTVTGKPANCDETYLQGHRDYSANKELWDSYSADTDSVCQSQFGKGQPSPCVHGVQLSIDGNPYYLCWYKN